jgi:thioredoxin 1
MTDTNYGPEPTRDEVDRMAGLVLLEFGANWCGYCRAIRRDLADLLRAHPDVRHIKVADGRGQPLGRSFRVKLWPTLVFMRNGRVLYQVSRPDISEMEQGFAELSK